MNTGTEEQKHEQQDEGTNTGQADHTVGQASETEETTDDSPEMSAARLEIDQLQAQLKEINDKYLRQVAEFDNFRKRTAREKADLIRSGTEDLMKALLEVLDDMDRAAQQMEANEDMNLHKDGLALVFAKLNRILQSKGLKAMESRDQDFDADLFEAITEIPAPTPEQKGKVLDEVQKGYYLNDKIIRHAKVVVGK